MVAAPVWLCLSFGLGMETCAVKQAASWENVFFSGGVDEWPGLLIREGISQAGAGGVAAVLPLCSALLVQLGLLGSAPPPTSSADPPMQNPGLFHVLLEGRKCFTPRCSPATAIGGQRWSDGRQM